MNGHRSVANFFFSGAARQALQPINPRATDPILFGYCSCLSSRSCSNDRSAAPNPHVRSRALEVIAPIKCGGKCPVLSINGPVRRKFPRLGQFRGVGRMPTLPWGRCSRQPGCNLTLFFHACDARPETVLECHFRCHFGRMAISSFYDETSD